MNTEDKTKYPEYLDEFITWCDASFLKLNTKVTKETYFDVALVVLGGDCIQVVNPYKYLDTVLDTIDENPTWTQTPLSLCNSDT